MKHRSLGKSGLKVSELCLGTMSFGWEADEAVSLKMLDRFADSGGNFIDTADIYADGASEAILGRWLKNRRRDALIIATKVRYATGKGPYDSGLSRRHIMSAIEASLRRLQTDYVDLYQIHCWDEATPLEETLRALDDLVKSGKVRHLGISNFTGWQLQKAMDLTRFMGLETFVSLQALYNLLDRFLEWDIIPVCENEGLGLLCWSPLAGGWLTGKIRRGMTGPPPGSRIEQAEKGGWSESWSNYDIPQTWDILDEFLAVAAESGKSPAQTALNWLLRRPEAMCPVIGANTLGQIEDNLASATWSLSADLMKRLDAASELPPPRYPHRFINRFNKPRRGRAVKID